MNRGNHPKGAGLGAPGVKQGISFVFGPDTPMNRAQRRLLARQCPEFRQYLAEKKAQQHSTTK
jgi:hypothetical protein